MQQFTKSWGISFAHIAVCTCVKMPVAIYVMWWNTRTLHHAQTMIQYTIAYMHSSSAEILWLRRSSEADVWTVVLQVCNNHTQLVISIWLLPPQQSFSCCCVSYFQGTELIILETLQHNEEAALEQLPIIHLPPTVSGWYTLICVTVIW